MRQFHALAGAALLTAGLAFAQFGNGTFQPYDGIVPSNGCPSGPSYFPWDYPYMQYNAHLNDAQHTPIRFAPYFIDPPQTWNGSGGHSHETQYTQRPGPVLLDATSGFTDASGNSAVFEVQLDGFSGWNTFSAHLVGGLAYTCVNNFLRYTTANPQRISRPLIPYPDNGFINQPQVLDYDNRHTGPAGPVYSRYMGEDYVTSLVSASTDYRSATLAGGAVDRARVTRCSLPYGGISDNDGGGLTPSPAFGGNWTARPFEQHLDGRECDLVNPSYGLPSSPNGALLLIALHGHTCNEGRYTPEGSYLPGGQPTDYWLGQDKIHVSCAPVGTTTKPPAHR